MEHTTKRKLLLQLLIDEFTGFEYDEFRSYLTQMREYQDGETLQVDQPRQTSEAVPELIAPIAEKTDWPREVPERLRALADATPVSSCNGCHTPNPEKDEAGNCEICGYPAYR